VLSRVAESLFWIGRNVERAETIARVLDVNVNRAVDVYLAPALDAALIWQSVVNALSYAHAVAIEARTDAWKQGVYHCAFDTDNPNSLVSCIAIARANAISVKADLSSESWEFINGLYLEVSATTAQDVLREGPSRFFHRVRDAAQGFAGVTDATLVHGEAWLFLQIGRFLERMSLMIRIIESFHVQEQLSSEWQRLLAMCCALEPFVRTVQGVPTADGVFAFLLLEGNFPRSARFCARVVDESIRQVSGTPPNTFANEAERLLGGVRAALDFAQVTEISREGLGPFLAMLRTREEEIDESIDALYFGRAPLGS
jgi:uncharacterized alpha-E superfamily protein